MRNLFILTAVLLCFFACKKSEEPQKPVGIPSIDSVTGSYKGSLFTHKDWYFPGPVVDSGRWDSSYAATVVVSKLTKDSIKLVFSTSPGEAHIYYYQNSGQSVYIGDPHHGGSYVYFYPAKDSLYYYHQAYGGSSQSYSNYTAEFKGKK